MLNRIRSAATQMRTEAEAKLIVSASAEAHAFFSRQIAVMPAVVAPAATNDDPLADAAVEVERELRVAGYLR